MGIEQALLGGVPTLCRDFVHGGVTVEELIIVDLRPNEKHPEARWRVIWAMKPWHRARVGGVRNVIFACECSGEPGVAEAREKLRKRFNAYYGIVEKGQLLGPTCFGGSK